MKRKRDLTNPSREGRRFVRGILSTYVENMINDGDYQRVEKELLEVIQAERRLVLRALKRTTVSELR